jgi:prefoldin subunit 5
MSLNQKAQQHAQKPAVEQQLELYKEHMQSLHNELFEVDMNIQEAQKCVDTLQNGLVQLPNRHHNQIHIK